MKLTIIFDNNPLIKDLQTGWGFSCLIETNNATILFDTGDDGKILLENMFELGINSQSIDTVFLSHYHHDHTGGLKKFLEVNSNATVVYPGSFPPELVEVITNNSNTNVKVKDFYQIAPGIYSLGELSGAIPEQSLAVRSSKGLVVITGCAHPGIVNILQKVKSKFPDEKIFLVLGGFHLHRLEEEKISDIVRTIHELGIVNVAPTHCSGSFSRQKFEEAFKTNYIEAGLGKIISIQ